MLICSKTFWKYPFHNHTYSLRQPLRWQNWNIPFTKYNPYETQHLESSLAAQQTSTHHERTPKNANSSHNHKQKSSTKITQTKPDTDIAYPPYSTTRITSTLYKFQPHYEKMHLNIVCTYLSHRQPNKVINIIATIINRRKETLRDTYNPH